MPEPHQSDSANTDANSLSWEEELDSAIFSFEDIQTELNYKQAQTALAKLSSQSRPHPPRKNRIGNRKLLIWKPCWGS